MKISGIKVNPIPTLSDNELIMEFLWEKPALANICTPLIMMIPNIIMVQPPSTASGRDAKKAPIGGNKPASIIQAVPDIIVKRLTTFVMAISPTF